MPPSLRIRFEAPFAEPHFAVDCWPPLPAHNVIFALALKATVAPYTLAIDAGKLSEGSANRIYAKLYAECVIHGSPTPGFEDMRPAEWEALLLEHPDHLAELREHLEHESNWRGLIDAVPQPGAAAGPGS